MFALAVVCLEARYGGAVLVAVEKSVDMFIAHQRSEFQICTCGLRRCSVGFARRRRLAVSRFGIFLLRPRKWPLLQCLRQSSRHFLERGVSEIAFGRKIRQPYCQPRLVFGRGQLANLASKILSRPSA